MQPEMRLQRGKVDRLRKADAEAGIGKGDKVSLLLENRPETIWLHFALAKIGALPVPINTAARGDLLSYYVTNSDSTAMIVEAEHVRRYLEVRGACPLVKTEILLDSGIELPDDPGRHVVPYDALLLNDAPPPVDVTFSDLVHIFYSSGTTGPSKGCMVANATLLSISANYVKYYEYTSEDVLYTCLPLFHGNAFNCTLVPALLSGARVVLSRRFSASRFWSDIRNYNVTAFTLLSAMTNILWNRPPSKEDRDHAARLCQIVPVPSFAREFEERYGVRIVSLYSLSDFGMGAIRGVDFPDEKWRSMGRVLPNVEVAIMDDDDFPVPNGQVGEICMRPLEPWVGRQGYYGRPDAWMAACRNLWFHSGDRGYMDDEGYLYFVDRKKDAIRRRGENISAYEVEEILLRHPAVAEVAAFPVPSELSEDEVMISVVRKPGCVLEEMDLIEFSRKHMAYYMVPRFVEFVDELPKTMTQKIEKFKLRESAAPRLSDIWDRERLGIVIKRSDVD